MWFNGRTEAFQASDAGSIPVTRSIESAQVRLMIRLTCLLYRHFGTWRSLVARLLWEQDVAGSNPVVPTMNLGCEPCRAITFGRARLSLTKKLTENKELSADLQVTNRCHLVCAETTKAPGP